MKLENKTGEGVQVPIKEEPTTSFVQKPVRHLSLLPGEVKEIPEEAIESAKLLGLTEVKAEKSSIGKVGVETKQVEELKNIGKLYAILSEEEVFAMNKKEQVEMLKSLGSKKKPKLEKDRVDLILELQDK